MTTLSFGEIRHLVATSYGAQVQDHGLASWELNEFGDEITVSGHFLECGDKSDGEIFQFSFSSAGQWDGKTVTVESNDGEDFVLTPLFANGAPAQFLSEEFKTNLGFNVAEFLNLKIDKDDYYPTTWGGKTARGLGASILRIVAKTK